MIRKYVWLTALSAAVALFLAGCVKDNGNYDYRTLTPIEIDMGLNSSTVVVRQLGRLKIEPTVVQGSGNENLTYRWQLKDDLYVPDPALGYFIDSLLSTDRVLDITVDLPARDYHLIYYVTDRTNGVTVNEKLSLRVETIAPQGLMVLHEEADGKGDVSMVMNPEVNAGIEGYSDDYVTHAIFSGNNEGLHPEEGAMIVAPNNGGNHIYLFQGGDRGGYRLSIADMKIIDTYQECFREGIEEVGFEGFALWSGSKEYLVNKGSIYFSDSSTPGVYAQYDVRCFGEPYDAAPYIGGNVTAGAFSGVRCCFFDKLSKRFLYIDYQPAVMAFTNSGTAFDPKKPLENETEMVYAQMGYPNNFYLALMQQPGNPSCRKIYAIDMNANWYDAGANAGAGLYDLSTADGMAQASLFAFGTRGPVIFYGTPQRIYRTLYENPSAAELLFDVTQEYPGYEISLLWMFNDSLSNSSYYGKLLYVGLWNPSTGDGKLLQYVVSETNGLVESGPKVYDGFGRIVSLGYKWK